jgi:YHS domain-containing protein
MVRVVLFLILFILIARAFWRVVDNVIAAASGQPQGRGRQAPIHASKMVRDPVCGTFVLPERSISVADGRERVYFCSEACRDSYHPRSGSGRAAQAPGRTA